MSAVPEILTKDGYVVHSWDWNEPFKNEPMVSVGIKVDNVFAKQIATIGIESNKIRFYAGNGYRHDYGNTVFSTYLSDRDENKFLLDFKEYVKGLRFDPYGSGYLVKKIENF